MQSRYKKTSKAGWIISTLLYVFYGVAIVWGFVMFILTDGRMGTEGGGYQATVISDFGDYYQP